MLGSVKLTRPGNREISVTASFHIYLNGKTRATNDYYPSRLIYYFPNSLLHLLLPYYYHYDVVDRCTVCKNCKYLFHEGQDKTPLYFPFGEHLMKDLLYYWSDSHHRAGVLPVAVCVWATGCILSMLRLAWYFFSLCRGNTTLVRAQVIRLHSRITPGSGCSGRSFSRTSCQHRFRSRQMF